MIFYVYASYRYMSFEMKFCVYIWSEKIWIKFGIREGLLLVNWKCMITREKHQRGGEQLNSFDPESGCGTLQNKMENVDAQLEEERNYSKAFYAMAEKVNKLFAEYEKTMTHPKKKEGLDDHASRNH